jgi:hypothetical protein
MDILQIFIEGSKYDIILKKTTFSPFLQIPETFMRKNLKCACSRGIKKTPDKMLGCRGDHIIFGAQIIPKADPRLEFRRNEVANPSVTIR